MLIALVVVVAILLSAGTYFGLERVGARGLVPFAARAAAWAAIGLLVLNVSCPGRIAQGRPLVLLDASLSMSGPGGRWREALDTAQKLGGVRFVGDERPGVDSTPSRGRSIIRPALIAAAAGTRPIVLVTDGEIGDAADLPADLLRRATVIVLPRHSASDLAIATVSGPARVTQGDTITVRVTLRATGPVPAAPVRVELRLGDRLLAARAVRLDASGLAGTVLVADSRRLPAGPQILTVAIAGSRDAEPRDDRRLLAVTVTETPGIVLAAAPGDWDSRFLYQTLREVADLPVRGFVQLAPGRWRAMDDLALVSDAALARAVRGADLLVTVGGAASLARGTGARGVWSWLAGAGQQPAVEGDWYAAATAVSPLAGAFVDLPVDSFAPLARVTPVNSAAGDWVAITARLSRRGAARPVVFGHEAGGRREVVTAADGFWRWRFRGGASEQAYRAWVAATVSWLLAGTDTAAGIARPAEGVVQNGLPLVFERTAPGRATAVVHWSSTARGRTDTLRFDGSGRARVWLPPGEYQYRLDGGGAGWVAVEKYSDEFLSRAPALTSHCGVAAAAPPAGSSRDRLWLFGLAVLALAVEWAGRRRVGLR